MRQRSATVLDAAWCLLLTVVLLGPTLLHRGYVLRGDQVFVPDQPWKGAWLGLDGRVPRFVPGDAVVWALGTVLPGDLVQKGLLAVALVAGGIGAGRLVRSHGSAARFAAIAFFVWNPWVYERLAIGQWGVVVGYLMLPWTCRAAERVRDRAPGSWRGLVGWLGLSAVFSPAAGLVALGVALAVVLVGAWAGRTMGPSVGPTLGTLAVGVAVNLPWILPAVVRPDPLVAPAAQFEAFAPRAESGLGVVGSVLSSGGIWKASVVPGERGSVLVVALSLTITLVGVLGLRLVARSNPRRVAALAAAALPVVGLTLLTSSVGIAHRLDDLASHVPALGILRDAHRYLGAALLALVPGLAAATDWVWQRAGAGREGLRAVALLMVVLPVLALPSLAWGLGGDWRPVAYPAEWYSVRAALPPGRTVVVPWRGSYRGFSWNGRHAVLDPAVRFFPGDVLVDDRLVVGARVLGSEDTLLDSVRASLAQDDPVPALERLGVRSVLEEKGNGGEPPVLPAARLVHDGPGLALWVLQPGTAAPSSGGLSPTRQTVVIAVDVCVLAGWGAAVAGGLLQRVRRRPRRSV